MGICFLFEDVNYQMITNQHVISFVAMVFCACPMVTTGQDKDSAFIGDAWSDTRNPVAQVWNGQRLDLWSLKPPVRPIVPAESFGNHSHSPVDCFVAEKLKIQGIRMSCEADRRTLVRRLTLDLHGLPPTPEEVEDFLLDDAPNAYERLVDRLLASPHYGVRWARHWLDVVRYADTNGFERDEFRDSMWRYRDYVVQAFNDDLPYDEFIREQLAGDELASLTPTNPRVSQQRTATGFMRLGPWDNFKFFFDSELAARDDLLTDLTNTTGSAFMGQTLSCCRCHDHKSEPLLHADHYRIRAHFAAIDLDNEVIIDSPEREEEVISHNAKVEEQLAPLGLELEVVLRPGRERLRAKTIATFPPDIQELLKLPEEQRDLTAKQRLVPYLENPDF